MKNLQKILDDHQKWLLDECGKRADLRDAYLRDADLRGAYLRGAYLRDADLRGADLRGACMRDADLRDADFFGAKNAPLVLIGSKHLVVHHAPGHISVGCEEHTYEHWYEHCEEIGFENGYTEKELEEYRALITCAIVQGRIRDEALEVEP